MNVAKHCVQDYILRVKAAFEINCHYGNPACSFFKSIPQNTGDKETTGKFCDRTFQGLVGDGDNLNATPAVQSPADGASPSADFLVD